LQRGRNTYVEAAPLTLRSPPRHPVTLLVLRALRILPLCDFVVPSPSRFDTSTRSICQPYFFGLEINEELVITRYVRIHQPDAGAKFDGEERGWTGECYIIVSAYYRLILS
jgi:hypothetical protein